MLFSRIGVNGLSGLYVFAVFYGVFLASLQSLFPASLTSLTMDLEKIAVRTGMVLSISFAALTGSPIAGALIQSGSGSYLYAQCFATVIMLVGTTLVTVARIYNTGLKLKAGM
jgi:hypothetical protein